MILTTSRLSSKRLVPFSRCTHIKMTCMTQNPCGTSTNDSPQPCVTDVFFLSSPARDVSLTSSQTQPISAAAGAPRPQVPPPPVPAVVRRHPSPPSTAKYGRPSSGDPPAGVLGPEPVVSIQPTGSTVGQQEILHSAVWPSAQLATPSTAHSSSTVSMWLGLWVALHFGRTSHACNEMRFWVFECSSELHPKPDGGGIFFLQLPSACASTFCSQFIDSFSDFFSSFFFYPVILVLSSAASSFCLVLCAFFLLLLPVSVSLPPVFLQQETLTIYFCWCCQFCCTALCTFRF